MNEENDKGHDFLRATSPLCPDVQAEAREVKRKVTANNKSQIQELEDRRRKKRYK